MHTGGRIQTVISNTSSHFVHKTCVPAVCNEFLMSTGAQLVSSSRECLIARVLKPDLPDREPCGALKHENAHQFTPFTCLL